MIVTVRPSVVNGTIISPASKSSMQRACAAALLHAGTTIISRPGNSNDDLAAIEVIQKLGASTVVNEAGELVVTSSGEPVGANGEMNCGESGLGIRMFTPLAALSNRQITISGTGSLLSRPMGFFDEILPRLGVSVQSAGGRLPLVIKGPLKPAAITVDGSLSSQFLTGLLMAFARAAKERVTITVTNLKSRPYIDLTLQVLKHFGYDVQHQQYESFIIAPPVVQPVDPVRYTVEGDWSGAAFLLVAGAVAGSLSIKGLDIRSTQADKAILQALMMAEARLLLKEDEIEIASGRLRAFHFNATDCPDLFPPLVALAAYCDGTTVIEGVSRLAHKESDRGLTLQQEFGKMGIIIDLQGDQMLVYGGPGVKGAFVHSHHDHRIAMACAVAALKADGETIIEEAQAINKSYPDFFAHIRAAGADIAGFD